MHKRTSENQSVSLNTQQKSKRLKGELKKLSPEKLAEIQQSTAPPERFQMRPDIIVNRKLTEEEINLATETISKSIADYHEILPTSQFSKSVKNTLKFISQEFVEVPYIWTYKKDFITEDSVTTVLSRADLWRIFDLEYDFRKFVEMRDQLNSKISMQDSYVSKVLSEANDIDELNDLNIYIKYQETKTTPEEEIHELRRKGVVSNIKYLEYVNKGLLKIVEKFGVQVPLFVKNLYSETKSHQPINEDLSPLEIIQQYYPKYKAPEELLQQSLELLAYEISIDPMFRKFVYNNYMQHGFLTTSGPLEVISNDDECWSFCFWKVQIQKAFYIDGSFAQILYYKNQNLINISFQLNNKNEFLEKLKNNIVSDNIPTLNSHVQWNKYRVDIVLKAYNEIIRPKIESRLIAKLKVNAEQWIMEQCMLNLEKNINIKPLSSGISKSIIPHIFALSSGFNESETYHCIYLDKNGKMIREWSWSLINGFKSMKNEFLNALNEFSPQVVVVQCCDLKTMKQFHYVKYLVQQHNEKQLGETIITTIDDAVALEIAKEEYPVSSSKYCLSLGRLAQNSLMEHLRLGDKIVNIKFNSLQYLLPENKLKKALDRAFINVVNEIGVDINDSLHDELNEPKQRALSYVCGFGPQKLTQFKRRIFGDNYDQPFIDSRSALKDYLEPMVYHNCVGFLRIFSNPKEPLDNSRIHPDFYKLAYSNAPNIDGKYFLMQLINKENKDPFDDIRQDYKMLTTDDIFEMVTKETKDSLYPGLIIPVVVNHVTSDVIKVSLKKSGFESNIDQNYIDNNIKVGDILDALVISINKEDIAIKLSCMREDLEKGHHRSLYNKRFDEFIDKKAKQNYFPHPNFKRVTVQEAERELSTQPSGSYIIRPTTAEPNKLSVTWKVYNNVYRHLHIIEMDSEVEFEAGHRFLVESEEEMYETLDELLASYIEKTNGFIDMLINHQKFRPTENQLNEFLEDYLQNHPYAAYGFYIDNLYPGTFVCGYKVRPGNQMLKMRGFFRPYGLRVENSRFYDIHELINGIKRKIQKECVEL